ncbi:hypothetical protein L6164_000780 [Bauhinia variegata]|uniref:Uncharacterized protein n=1 Tax=Bauhinia variegata TaxID=167791 RepID=A0ACB9Q6W9_BAUVA|nr:hypothetical protein L6164_000780 [Bauhinia variegata]
MSISMDTYYSSSSLFPLNVRVYGFPFQKCIPIRVSEEGYASILMEMVFKIRKVNRKARGWLMLFYVLFIAVCGNLLFSWRDGLVGAGHSLGFIVSQTKKFKI